MFRHKKEIINYKAGFRFTGQVTKLYDMLPGIFDLKRKGLMIDTTPLPEGGMGFVVEFNGSISDFEKIMPELRSLRKKGLMIDTVPLPEKGTTIYYRQFLPSGLTIIDDRQVTPAGSIVLHSTPNGTFSRGCIAIGSWPTPEKGTNYPYIDTVPLPEKTLKEIDKHIRRQPRINMIGIDCGILNPHIHIKDEAVIFDQEEFIELVGDIASELARNLAKNKDYITTVKSLHRLLID